MTTSSKSLVKTIAITGFVAGTLDIAIALIMFTTSTGKSALVVLRFIAAGIFGPDALKGGNSMAIAGLLLHYLIAYLFTIGYFLAYRIISKVSGNWIVNAIFYGIIVWSVMNLAVLPLSNVPHQNLDLTNAIRGAIILILAIGLPVSFSASRYYSKP